MMPQDIHITHCLSTPKYLDAVRHILDFIQDTQLPAIEEAADLCVQALTHGGIIYCHGIGHGNEGDFLGRAGGLAAVQRFSFSFNVSDAAPDCLKDRPREQSFERDLEVVRFAVRASNLRRGDVMLVSSVSGRNCTPIELALACRDIGVRIVCLTSMEYTKRVESLHPSGSKLFEAADVAIDIGAPYGDAAVDVPGLDYKALPVSGVAMTVIGWLIWERVMEKMGEAGDPPTVYMSINREGGQEHYQKSQGQYNRRGY